VQSYNWRQIPEEQMNPLVSRQVIHGETMTVARLRLKKGAHVPLHHHVNEQVSIMESGVVRFVIGGEEVVARGGDVVRIPPNVPHEVTAEDDCLVFDLFSPPRADWIRGDDAYLRK
jgi:quercetin dioxygenase-like cupin family protein